MLFRRLEPSGAESAVFSGRMANYVGAVVGDPEGNHQDGIREWYQHVRYPEVYEKDKSEVEILRCSTSWLDESTTASFSEIVSSMDFLFPAVSKRKLVTLLVSANLRQPESVPLAEKEAYAEKCIKMCGLVSAVPPSHLSPPAP
ncbi:hypothetical protein EDD85DRAFT_987017 [Armillaria nabsnona]|nr:hypothetical protein EDD85DRAFT_987017 [Armillaria nabsnona]